MRNKVKHKKKGQSTLEYLVVLTGIIGLVIVFAGPSGVFQTALNNTFKDATNGMENMAGRLKGSRPVAP